MGRALFVKSKIFHSFIFNHFFEAGVGSIFFCLHTDTHTTRTRTPCAHGHTHTPQPFHAFILCFLCEHFFVFNGGKLTV
jgi:hypothetical protein